MFLQVEAFGFLQVEAFSGWAGRPRSPGADKGPFPPPGFCFSGERYIREGSMTEAISAASRQGAGVLTADLGRATVANTPNPVGLVHPGVGQARILDVPRRAWTNVRPEPP